MGKKALAWKAERDQWFLDHPEDYFTCHYCEKPMDKQNTTLDHENNRNHGGRLFPCCWICNSNKGSVSHDRYVEKYHEGHVCAQ